MTTILTVRTDLAANLQTALDALGWDQTPVAYDYPAESIALPAVVIVPDEPYWTPNTFKGAGSVTAAIRVNFELQLIVPRTEVEEGIGNLEALGIACGVGVTSGAPVFRWVDLSQPEPVEVGGISAILARMAVTAIV